MDLHSRNFPQPLPATAEAPMVRNRLLARLLRDCPSLAPALERRTEPTGAELCQEGAPLDSVWFPERGVASLVVRLRDGAMADVRIIGNEGMAGLPAWLGLDTSPDTVLQQASGEAVRIDAARFVAAVRHSGHAQRLLAGYTAYSLRAGSQTCACNAHHDVRQRLCRWLLTAADHAGSSELEMSQSMLAAMLGVRRQSVGEVLVEVAQAGAIAQRRGRVLLLDPPALHALACECYDTTRTAYERLVAPLL
ncbi:Crp/Fnr family transcriptional regulator [Azohydromonas aeria]|uniref:Crp/Fnr family transcriptional regulator n=1 Tax=Azohydromonas aeria TaxID=2590212 RepID=UPI0012F992BB|nr:Crp/Fnr family transcriptional regulator [Azohydromonas aeria]